MSDQFWKSINPISSIIQEYQSSMPQIAEINSYILSPSLSQLKEQMGFILNPSVADSLRLGKLNENIRALKNQPTIELSKKIFDSTSIKPGISINTLQHLSEQLISLYSDDTPEDEANEIIETDSKIITEIYKEDLTQEKKSNTDTVIVLSPINDQILKYLSENPAAIYHLKPGEFEIMMAEIYSKLGYHVERTQETKDGGKDIIIRKPSILGDFIYYVECKKYAPKRPIGIGIVRGMVGTINTDKVNGGIIATTSYFTRDARKFILSNDLKYQVQMHDYEKIQELLKQSVR